MGSTGTRQKDVGLLARLAVGKAKLAEGHRLLSGEELARYGGQLAAHTHQIAPKFAKQADCMDKRRIIGTASGVTDPAELRRRLTPQVAGGLGLAITQGAVAANAAIIKEAKSLQQAYQWVHKELVALGFRDGGHADCKASHYAQDPIANHVPIDLVHTTLTTMTGGPISMRLLEANNMARARRLEEGFFGGWNPGDHEAFLADVEPDNFLILDTADRVDASGLYLVADGYGFAKNEFIEETGERAYAMTPSIIFEAAHKLGGTDEERSRIAVGSLVNAIDIAQYVFEQGQPIFA